jgi:hypothetical protein
MKLMIADFMTPDGRYFLIAICNNEICNLQSKKHLKSTIMKSRIKKAPQK